MNNFFFLTLTLTLAVLAGPASAQQPVDQTSLFQFNQRPDAGALATKYAESIASFPECDMFRQQLANLSSGSAYDSQVISKMTLVLQRARGAGCHATVSPQSRDGRRSLQGASPQ